MSSTPSEYRQQERDAADAWYEPSDPRWSDETYTPERRCDCHGWTDGERARHGTYGLDHNHVFGGGR